MHFLYILLTRLHRQEDKIRKTFASAAAGEPSDTVDPMKSAFACLRFLLVNATRYGADAATFNEELQQLGLPREHSAAICRVRDEFLPEITALLTEKSLTGIMHDFVLS